MNLECVIFSLEGQKYAIDIMRILEVRECDDIKPMANAKSELIGVLDLREQIVPVFDLALLFGLEASAIDPVKNIIIAKFDDARIGFMVDSVTDIEKFYENEIRNTDGFNNVAKNQYVHSIYSKNDDVIVLVDTEALHDTCKNASDSFSESLNHTHAA